MGSIGQCSGSSPGSVPGMTLLVLGTRDQASEVHVQGKDLTSFTVSLDLEKFL